MTTYAVFAHHPLPIKNAVRLYFPTNGNGGHSDGLEAFRGLMLAVPIGGCMWVGFYYLVRAVL